MYKLIAIIGIVAMALTIARADVPLSYVEYLPLEDSVEIASTDTVNTKAFLIEQDKYFSVFLKAGGTTPHVKILEHYNFGKDFPADATKWAEIDKDGADMLFENDFTQTEWTVTAWHPKYSIWARFSLIGLATNGADAYVIVKVLKQRVAKARRPYMEAMGDTIITHD